MASKQNSSWRYRFNLGMTAVVAITIGIIIIILVLASWQLDSFLTARPSIPEDTPAKFKLSYRDLRLQTSDQLEIAAWEIPARSSPAPGVVLVHGLGANRAAMLPVAQLFWEHGYHILLIDLRAHGESEGELVSYGFYEGLDVVAALDHLASSPEVDSDRIVVVGSSLGGAAAIRGAAVSDIPNALIVESTFSSLPAGIDDAFSQMSLLPQWLFAPIIIRMAELRLGEKIESVDSTLALWEMSPIPILLIHGDQDDLIPIHHHQALLAAAQGPSESWLVPGMGHESPLTFASEDYERRVFGFLERYLVEAN